jgi:hypothetical protein
MPRVRPTYLYHCYRFFVALPVGKRKLGLSNVFVDPMTAAFWLGRAHQEEEDGFLSLKEALDGEEGEIQVWMFSGYGGETCRLLTVHYDSFVWIPLDLDATRSEVAMEWIRMDRPVIRGPVDYKTSELPDWMGESSRRPVYREEDEIKQTINRARPSDWEWLQGFFGGERSE